MKNLITMTAVLAVVCSVALAVPVYTVLHQSDGTAVDSPVNGYMDYIIDNSPNGNDLYSQNTIGIPNDIGGMTRLSTDGPAGVGDAYTRTRNGGTCGTNALVDLQTQEFYWEMDLRFEPNATGAGQGGIGGGSTHIIGSKYNEHGEGVSMNANADGSLSAHLSAYLIGVTITTDPGLVADNVWVNVGLSFEGVTDGGLFDRPEWAPGDWVSDQRQIWSGTLKIYVNGQEEASGAGGLILNDEGYGPFLAAWGPTPLGFTPNLGFDNVLISGIPEPATMSLLALGGLALIRRKK